MKLLYVSHSFPPESRPLSNVGGMQRVATDLYEALRGHSDVELEALVLRTSWRWAHLRTGPFLAASLMKIQRMLERKEVDAVLFSSMVTASLAVPLKAALRENGAFAAAIVHGRDVTLSFPPYQKLLVPAIFEALDAVLPVSKATGEACLLRGLPAGKLFVVPNGIVTDRFPHSDAGEPLRQALKERFQNAEFPLPNEALLLCSVGRQVRRKGFAWFVQEVLPLLPSNVHYWLAGNGPESGSILAAARKKGLHHRVRLLGRISDEDLSLLYRGADLFVMPNIPIPGDMEGFGVVMLEAGLAGLPTVAARLEGIMDVISEDQNGHLVESGDAWGFSEAIMAYYDARDRLQESRRRARDFVLENFGWSGVANQYLNVIRAVTASPAERQRMPV